MPKERAGSRLLERVPRQVRTPSTSSRRKAVMHIRQAKSAELMAIGDEIVALLNEYGEPREGARLPPTGAADFHGWRVGTRANAKRRGARRCR